LRKTRGGNTLCALDADSGAFRWATVAVPGGFVLKPTVAGGVVFVGTDKGWKAFDARTGAHLSWAWPPGTRCARWSW